MVNYLLPAERSEQGFKGDNTATWLKEKPCATSRKCGRGRLERNKHPLSDQPIIRSHSKHVTLLINSDSGEPLPQQWSAICYGFREISAADQCMYL